VIVSLPRFLKDRQALLAREEGLGVRLETSESPQALGSDVHNFALIVLHVPYFKDGRAFSWGAPIAPRLGYKGEIRCHRTCLARQIAFFARVGVDSFELAERFQPPRSSRRERRSAMSTSLPSMGR